MLHGKQLAEVSVCHFLMIQADATTDYAGIVGQVVDAGCGSVVTATYAADGAAIHGSTKNSGICYTCVWW